MPLHPFLKANVCYISDTESTPEKADEHALEERTAKRRRIEVIAQSYLRGQPIYIQTAQLKGPFDNSWMNPWLSDPKEEMSRTGKTAGISRKAVSKKAAKTKNSDVVKGKTGQRGLNKQADSKPGSKTNRQSSKANQGKERQKIEDSQPVRLENPIEEITVEKSVCVQTIGEASGLSGVSSVQPAAIKTSTLQMEYRHPSGFTPISISRSIPKELENAVSPIKPNQKTKPLRKKAKSGDAVPSHLRPPLTIKHPSINVQNEFSPGFPFRKVTKPNKAFKKVTPQLEKKLDKLSDSSNIISVPPVQAEQSEAFSTPTKTPPRFMALPAPVFTPINLLASTTDTTMTSKNEMPGEVSQGKRKRKRKSKEMMPSSQDNQGSITQLLAGFRQENIGTNRPTPVDYSKHQNVPSDTTNSTIKKALDNTSTKLIEFETRSNTHNTPQEIGKEGNEIPDIDTTITPPVQSVSTHHSQLTLHPVLAELEVQTTEEDSTLISFGPSPSKQGGPNLSTQVVLDFAQGAFFDEPSSPPAPHETNGYSPLTSPFQQAQQSRKKDGDDEDELDLDTTTTNNNAIRKFYITPFRDFRKSLGAATDDQPTSTINFNKHAH